MRYALIPFIFLLALVIGEDSADARKVRIPIPSFSRGETLVKVQDLPARAPFIDKEGNPIALGYLWDKSGVGQWVGYKSETSFFRWTPEQIEIVKILAGIKEMPPVPERPADLSSVGGFGGAFWIVVIGLSFAFSLWKKFMGRATAEPASRAMTAPDEPLAAPMAASLVAANSIIDRRPVGMASPTAGPAAAPTLRPRREPRAMAQGTPARATFGRR
jgi:hypothetical protein